MAPAPSASDSYLGTTLGSFANRISRGLKEQEQRFDDELRAREIRHAAMLEAMILIRRALQETSKTRLNDRFSFVLDVSDWEGWPRLEFQLIDVLAPDRRNFILIVTANDHMNLGAIQIARESADILGKVCLSQFEEFKKIPLVLKRSVREFLDSVGNYILNPLPPQEIETATPAIELSDKDEVSAILGNEDVFAESGEDYSPNQNQVDRDEPAPLRLSSVALKI